MNANGNRRLLSGLIVGDLIVLGLVTAVGFASHGELGTAGMRLLTTFIPLLVGWFAVAPLMGAYQLENNSRASQLWRPFWAMVVAAPLAAWLRGVWLNAPILPFFVFVLGGVAALAILIWRAIFLWRVISRKIA